MSDIPPIVSEVEPVQIVDSDCSCARCGYNLRGLRHDQNCPECGSEVAQSLLGNFLRFSDPDWLGKLCLATKLMLWVLVLAFVGILIATILSGTLSLPPLVQNALAVLVSAVGTYAAFLLTTQEPSQFLREDPVTLRKVVRTSALVSFGGDLLEFASTAIDAELILQLLIGTSEIAGVVYGFGVLVFLRKFAERIPDPILAQSTKKFMWYSIFLLIGCVILGAAAFVSPAATGGVVFSCMVPVVLLIMCIWYLRLLTSYQREFKSAEEESRRMT